MVYSNKTAIIYLQQPIINIKFLRYDEEKFKLIFSHQEPILHHFQDPLYDKQTSGLEQLGENEKNLK
jgi:hypothetical protein